jgi:hypothetical protein
VYIIKISSSIKPNLVTDELGDGPVHTNLIANCNTELQNNSMEVIEYYASDAGYVIKKKKKTFAGDITRHVEATGL